MKSFRDISRKCKLVSPSSFPLTAPNTTKSSIYFIDSNARTMILRQSIFPLLVLLLLVAAKCYGKEERLVTANDTEVWHACYAASKQLQSTLEFNLRRDLARNLLHLTIFGLLHFIDLHERQRLERMASPVVANDTGTTLVEASHGIPSPMCPYPKLRTVASTWNACPPISTRWSSVPPGLCLSRLHIGSLSKLQMRSVSQVGQNHNGSSSKEKDQGSFLGSSRCGQSRWCKRPGSEPHQCNVA